MRYFRAHSPLDDLIGGLVQETRRDMSVEFDPLVQERWYDRVFRAAANALVHELRRPGTILPNFISSRTDYGDRVVRAPMENFWAVQVSEGALTQTSLDESYRWPRALGYAHQTVIESVFAELREEGIL